MQAMMVDLETMSSDMDAVICAIGAVVFDPYGESIEWKQMDMEALPPSHFYINVDIDSCLQRGLKTSGSTIYWWLNQDKQAQQQLLHPTPIPLDVALVLFQDWIRLNKVEQPFAHANFDLSILHTAYKACGMKLPWKYTNARDVRTALAARPGVVMPQNYKHNALQDAMRQAIGVQAALR